MLLLAIDIISRKGFIRSVYFIKSKFLISASGSLDLVDLHGVWRPDWYHQGPVKGCGSTSYHPIPLARPKS